MSDKINIDEVVKFKDGKKVILDGPLSRIFTQTLNEMYPKQVEPVTGIVLESQIFQSMQSAAAKWATVNQNVPEIKNDNYGILYTVDSDEAIAKDLSNIAAVSTQMTNGQLDNSAVIIDGLNSKPTAMTAAIESYCRAVNIPVYNSLKSFMATKGF
jgi:hypothetical protein